MPGAKTVLVTGASGFLAKHIVLQALNAGHNVVGSLRDLARGPEVRAAVAPFVTDAATLDARLRFVALDLTRDDGWAQAMAGVDALIHTASPFPISQPKDAEDLIRPAVDGTLRALRAARDAGVRRVVLTSSEVAVMSGALRAGQSAHDESNWSDLEDPQLSPYARSKTQAERAAWDFAAEAGLALTTINPGFILGPPLDAHFGSSIGVVQRMLKGKDPMMPALGLTIVDVRDVADLHLRALDRPDTAGNRYLATAGSMWMAEMGRALKAEFPDRRIATRTAPNFVMRLLGLFDSQIRSIVPALGRYPQADNAKTCAHMDFTFRPPQEALIASARYLLDKGLA